MGSSDQSPCHTVVTNGNGTVTQGTTPSLLPTEPPQLPPPRCLPDVPSPDAEIRLALELSEREMKDAEIRRTREEEELEMILALSLTEK